ncbi:hypothetical protein NEMBOFW57_009113 [Staphylotrichum longicolle]|uniref:Uncharacterized protein n=1 Tax=Staphylotrichum longicolle TaxID=669026 RepID=A0AAD4ESE7_9PEZI|nr:hypothetical protein NEMBOFW57_009113 [Staphylotrichum longicolle]
MGNHFSKKEQQRTHSRPSTSSGNTRPAPTTPYHSYQQRKLDPRDQQFTPYTQQQQQPTAKPTGKRRRGKKPKPEYKLKVICSACKDPESCRTAFDLNIQYMNAYRDPAYRGAQKPWTLQVNLCDWADRDKVAETVLRKYVKDRAYGAYDDDHIFCADDLLRELRTKGVPMWSSI